MKTKKILTLPTLEKSTLKNIKGGRPPYPGLPKPPPPPIVPFPTPRPPENGQPGRG